MPEVSSAPDAADSEDGALEVAGTCLNGFREGEELLDDSEEWLRACAEDHWDDESKQVSALMFQWGSADDGQLSGARAQKTTPEAVYRHQVDVERKATRGVWGVQVEALSRSELHVHDDSALLPSPPASPPAHAFLDLQHVASGKKNPAKRERERIRALLLENAQQRYRNDVT